MVQKMGNVGERNDVCSKREAATTTGFMQRMGKWIGRHAKGAAGVGAAAVFFSLASPALSQEAKPASPPVACNSASLNRNYATGNLLRYPQLTFYGRLLQSEGKTTAYQEGVLATANSGNVSVALTASAEQPVGAGLAETQTAGGYVSLKGKLDNLGAVYVLGGAKYTWTNPAATTSVAPEFALALDASGVIPVYTTAGITPTYSYAMANFGAADWLVLSGKAQFNNGSELVPPSTDFSGGADVILPLGNGGKVHFFASAGGNSQDGDVNSFNAGARVFNSERYWVEANASQNTATDATAYTLLLSVPLK